MHGLVHHSTVQWVLAKPQPLILICCDGQILLTIVWLCGCAVPPTGAVATAAEHGGRGGNKRKRKPTSIRAVAERRGGVMPTYLPTDVSHIEVSGSGTT